MSASRRSALVRPALASPFARRSVAEAALSSRRAPTRPSHTRAGIVPHRAPPPTIVRGTAMTSRTWRQRRASQGRPHPSRSRPTRSNPRGKRRRVPAGVLGDQSPPGPGPRNGSRETYVPYVPGAPRSGPATKIVSIHAHRVRGRAPRLQRLRHADDRGLARAGSCTTTSDAMPGRRMSASRRSALVRPALASPYARRSVAEATLSSRRAPVRPSRTRAEIVPLRAPRPAIVRVTAMTASTRRLRRASQGRPHPSRHAASVSPWSPPMIRTPAGTWRARPTRSNPRGKRRRVPAGVPGDQSPRRPGPRNGSRETCVPYVPDPPRSGAATRVVSIRAHRVRRRAPRLPAAAPRG
jgi:hypothetical protein